MCIILNWDVNFILKYEKKDFVEKYVSHFTDITLLWDLISFCLTSTNAINLTFGIYNTKTDLDVV